VTELREEKQLNGFCAVEVTGESCAGCFALMPIVKSVCDRRGDIRAFRLEMSEECAPLLQKWQIDRVPTVLLIKDGEVFARCTGYQPEEILEIWMDAKIEEFKNR